MFSDRLPTPLLGNVATPLWAVTETGVNVAPPGLFRTPAVTVPLKVGSILPYSFTPVTVRPNVPPAMVLAGGCAVTTRNVASASLLTAIGAVVTGLRVPLDAWSVKLPVWFSTRVNVADPLTAVTEVGATTALAVAF